MGQLKAGILPYNVIYKNNDDRHGAFSNAQKTLGRIIREKEKWKQQGNNK